MGRPRHDSDRVRGIPTDCEVLSYSYEAKEWPRSHKSWIRVRKMRKDGSDNGDEVMHHSTDATKGQTQFCLFEDDEVSRYEEGRMKAVTTA